MVHRGIFGSMAGQGGSLVIWGIRNVLAARRRTSIDLFEWDRADVTRKRLPNGPAWLDFATPSGSLRLSGIRLAHAVVRADYLIRRNYALPSLGFVLEMSHIIDFSSPANLRLLPGASAILNDVTQSSLAARVGQGLSLLFAESRHYDFVGHLASDPSVLAHLVTSGRQRVADFLFEDRAKDRMILESKATFSLETDQCTRVKGMLKEALHDQVDYWMGIISPTPAKGFALYSCLRESGNSTRSSISFVDPPGSKGDVQIELPPDWVRRYNYAGWLRAMGLRDAANRLWGAPERIDTKVEPATFRLPIADVNGRSFALGALTEPFLGSGGSFVLGIDVDALRTVSGAIQGSRDELLSYRPQREKDEDREAAFSVFADGSLFGLIDLRHLKGSEAFVL